MHCRHCSSLMVEIEIQKDKHTEQTRLECPNCGRVRLQTCWTSDYQQARAREESSRYLHSHSL